MRSAVGPELRSNAEPTALGVVVATVGLMRRLGDRLPLMRPCRTLRSFPAWRRALAAGAETCVVEDEFEPVCTPPVLLEPPPPLGFPPPADGRHSL
jgi:hypothetical protein